MTDNEDEYSEVEDDDLKNPVKKNQKNDLYNPDSEISPKFDYVGFIEDFEKKWVSQKKARGPYRRYRIKGYVR